MHSSVRATFNRAFSPALFEKLQARLFARVGTTPFPLAETPLFLDPPLREALGSAAEALTGQLLVPATLAKLRGTVPARYDVPETTALPDCVQVDFALADDGHGGIVPRLVELQAFPSLYAFESLLADAWAETLEDQPGLGGPWTCFFEGDRERAQARVRRAILGGEDPSEVVLVDYAPERQKTVPDFVASQQLFGIDAVCVTTLEVEGRKLYRRKDGQRVQVKRIFNRMVFDELEAKQVRVPFDWREPLDVTWCSHPNWYWIWSKYALPFLDHATVPRARLLSDLDARSLDLSRYVLKPLYSFAGTGVMVDVTLEAIDAIPPEDRPGWLLQEKITYADAIRAPEFVGGFGVKAEVRVMMIHDPEEDRLRTVLPLVRLSRGKLLGVDHNKNLSWVGASVGLWTP
jgi:hypothetical protein